MSINKDRKFRFKFGDFEESVMNPNDESSAKSVTKPVKAFTIHDPNRTANMDAQTQSRLHAMAMQAKANGGNSSGMDAEYLSKIPARQHNMITMSCAGDKLKELKEKMNEEIKTTSADSGTTDILEQTANDHIIYKDYDLESLDKYTEKIGTMSLFESVSLKNSVLKELNRLESCHTMVKAVDDLRENFDFVTPGKEPTMMDRKMAGTNVDKQILTANYLDEYGYSESADEFAKLYEAYQPKLEELVKKLNEHIEECGKEAASTKYMTNDFLHIIDKKINNMDSTEVNYDFKMKGLNTLKEAFSNRTDLSFLTRKLVLFSNNKTHLKNLAKAMTGTFSDVASKLNNNFATKTMSAFIKELDEFYSGNMYWAITALYFLDYVCTSESKNSNDAWVKIFVLNASDIHNGIWDLDMSAHDYGTEIIKNINPLVHNIANYLMDRKVKISNQITTQYNKLLNWTPEVEETTESEEEPKTEDDVEHVEAEVIDLNEVHGTFDTTRNEVIDVDPVE